MNNLIVLNQWLADQYDQGKPLLDTRDFYKRIAWAKYRQRPLGTAEIRYEYLREIGDPRIKQTAEDNT